MNKDIDIIIYGATGFTGQLCVKYFQSLETTVKWAIAGRNTEKLNKVAADNQTAVEILVADADDEFALDKLTYWNVELQEPYFSYVEASKKRDLIK